MPHCVLWRPADWEFALDTLELSAQFYEGRNVAGELRLRQGVMGTTRDHLVALRIRYVDEDQGDDDQDGTVTDIADYKAML